MGNASSHGKKEIEKKKKVAEVVAPSKKPELLRMESTGDEQQCAICLENKVKGLSCFDKKHFLCTDCFSPYVATLTQDIGKLRDSKFEVLCPVPGCSSRPWNSYHVRKGLEGEALEKYMDVLVRAAASSSQSAGGHRNNSRVVDGGVVGVERVTSDLISILSLKCPHCNQVLDQNPDGCCAIRCPACAGYFCWLCFSEFRSSADCHSHIRTVCELSGGDLFPAKPLRLAAHKQYRIRLLRERLRQTWIAANRREDPDSCTVEVMSKSASIKGLVESIRPLLIEVGITPEEILTSSRTIRPNLSTSSSPLSPILVAAVIVCVFFLISQYLNSHSHSNPSTTTSTH